MGERFTLARLDHLAPFHAILLRMGAVCPKCGHGTRNTSKRWARCKRCGERVERNAVAAAPPEGERDG